jgi:hypothetical protein
MEARKNNLRPEEAVTIALKDLYGDEIKEIIGLITKDLIYTTDMEKYLSRTNDKDLDYDSIHIDYRKNREIEIHCSRHSRADLGAGRSEAEYFTLHITQGSENADITIEAKGPSSTYNKDLLLERVKEYAYPLNECVKKSNIMYDNITKPPVAVAPVAVVPPKPTNASTPASDKPLSMAERIALFNKKKGGRRSLRKSHKNRKSHKKSRKSRKSRKSHKKGRKSQRRQ